MGKKILLGFVTLFLLLNISFTFAFNTQLQTKLDNFIFKVQLKKQQLHNEEKYYKLVNNILLKLTQMKQKYSGNQNISLSIDYLLEEIGKEKKVCSFYALPPQEGCEIKYEMDVYGCEKPSYTCEENQTMCSSYSLAEPQAGCKYIDEMDANGCAKPKLVCEESQTMCPVYSLAEPKSGCKYIDEKDANGCAKPKLVCEEMTLEKYECRHIGTKSEGLYDVSGAVYKYVNCGSNLDYLWCKNISTKSEGWYYGNGDLYKYAVCSQ